MTDTVDYIFYGGVILTIEDDCPHPEALGLKGQTIHAVGTKDEVFSFAGPNTKYVELTGSQTLLPGLIEPHQHPTHMIQPRCSFVSCSGYYYTSYKQIEEVIKKTVAGVDPSSGKWCIFVGWDPLIVSDLPQLDVEILDAFSRDVPIFVISENRHESWANHKALEAAGVTESSPDPEGGCYVRDNVTKKLTGKLLEPTIWQAFINCAPSPTAEEIAQAVDDQLKEYACAGFTTVTELLHAPNEAIDKAVRNKASKPDCPIRLAIYEQISGPEDASKIKPSAICPDTNDTVLNEKLWFAGVKIISDGSPRCGTCATREPFLANEKTEKFGFSLPPSRGLLNYTNEELLHMAQHGHNRAKQLAIHAHGERAIEQVLDVYEKVIKRNVTI